LTESSYELSVACASPPVGTLAVGGGGVFGGVVDVWEDVEEAIEVEEVEEALYDAGWAG
jgi:threonine dehydratase